MDSAAVRPARRLASHDLTARGTVTAAVAAMAAVIVLDLIDGRIGFPFSLGFVLIVITLPLAINRRDLLPAVVLPPVLLLVSLLAICIVRPESIAVDGMADDASLIARYIASVVDHGLNLAVGHALAIAVIVWRFSSEV
ncbi:DUF6542 domain-containing protein [Aeromicrobium sp. CF3.5]|uniref:DUF6542 domain-containing protein n=1 Tax=Aeromicrobium sp. CF3.5 TaxID=3373078 RepID=UPI003EE546F9